MTTHLNGFHQLHLSGVADSASTDAHNNDTERITYVWLTTERGRFRFVVNEHNQLRLAASDARSIAELAGYAPDSWLASFLDARRLEEHVTVVARGDTLLIRSFGTEVDLGGILAIDIHRERVQRDSESHLRSA